MLILPSIMASPLQLTMTVIELLVCILSFTHSRRESILFLSSTGGGPYRLRSGVLGTALILFGTLPRWPSETALLPRPETTVWEPAFMLLNLAVAAVIVTTVIMLIRHGQTSGELLIGAAKPVSKGRKPLPWLAITAGISYVAIFVLTVSMKRVWALNRDPLIIWLLAGGCAALLFAEQTSRVAKLVYATSAGLILALLAYNLWLLCATSAGSISWALQTGVLPGMYLTVVGSIVILLGLRGKAKSESQMS